MKTSQVRKSLENKNFNKFSLAGKYVSEANNRNRKIAAYRTIGSDSQNRHPGSKIPPGSNA
jgi:hypothetical protein